jgi:hypothetical protein
MIYDAETVIRKSRQNLKELMGWHEKWQATNGKEGAFCFNYDELKEQSLMTDGEIIQYFINQGYNIANADKYLNEKKEKTN